MKCPNCSSEVPAQSGNCPHCGVFIVMPARDVFRDKERAPWTISLLVLGFLAIAAVVGLRFYLIFHRSSSPLGGNYTQPGPEPLVHSEFPIQHGEIAKAEDLYGHGKLYFVSVGKQAIPVESLAEYYRQKFKIEVTVLPAVRVRPTDYVPARKQYVAEELIADMTDAYPAVAWKRDSAMIALTDEDIFPLELGWGFTYSLHTFRFGIVSTRRMDPTFWGDHPNDAIRLASTKQMLTKYVALTYFHLPESFDPTSILYTPLTPNEDPDDIYESDLHPEQSVNGRRGIPNPCLSFRYSYKTHKIAPEDPVLSDCQYENPATSTDEEAVTTNLAWGSLIQRGMDIELNSVPAIEFRRGYQSDRTQSMALGMRATHSFDIYLSSDGFYAQSVAYVNREDGIWYYLHRMDKGLGFNPKSIYQSTDYPMYGALQTWESDHYK